MGTCFGHVDPISTLKIRPGELQYTHFNPSLRDLFVFDAFGPPGDSLGHFMKTTHLAFVHTGDKVASFGKWPAPDHSDLTTNKEW